MNRLAMGMLVLLFLAGTGSVFAQDSEPTAYAIGVGDRLRISVWQEPTLDRNVEVGVDSMIMLPLVGPIKAGGYSPVQLSRLLTEKYSLYKRDISQVEVVVVEYNSREVFVIGEIAARGRQTFQEIPDLWTVIMTAGGPTQSAYLGDVRILRGKGEDEKAISVNLNDYLLGGDADALPKLQPGDTIYIPASTTQGIDAFATSIIKVYGEVGNPGLYVVGEDETLVSAILNAGGVTQSGDETRIRIVRQEGDRQVVNTVNMNDYLKRGELHGNPVLKAGDVVTVDERKGQSWNRGIREWVTPTVATFGTIVGFLFLIDRIDRR